MWTDGWMQGYAKYKASIFMHRNLKFKTESLISFIFYKTLT